MHRDHILEKVRSGKEVEISWVILANGIIPQEIGLTIDESIKKWAKDNKIFVMYEEVMRFGKIETIVTFSP